VNIFEKIKQIESRKLEFKEQLPQGSAFLKIVSAFANGAGGELIIGICDKKRRIVGVDDPLLIEEQIMNCVHDGVYPPVSPFCTIITIQKRTLLSIRILSGSNKPYYIKSKGVDKGTFVRIGSTNRLADSQVVQELKRQVTGLAFIDEIDFQHQNISFNNKSLNIFFDIMGMVDNSKDTLVKLNIVKRNNGDQLPTIAGLLLFGSPDLSEYDYACVRFSRFAGRFKHLSKTMNFLFAISNFCKTSPHSQLYHFEQTA